MSRIFREKSPHLVCATFAALLFFQASPTYAQAKSKKRVVFIGLQTGSNVTDSSVTALEKAIVNAVAPAARERGYTIVDLDQVSRVPKLAAACTAQNCRRDIAKILGATHVISARLHNLSSDEESESPTTSSKPKASKPTGLSRTRLERRGDDKLRDDKPIDVFMKRPVGLTFGGDLGRQRKQRSVRGFQLTLWLESEGANEFVQGVKIEGEMPFLIGQLSNQVEKVLEAGSSKRATTIRRLMGTAKSYQEKGRTRDVDRTLRRAMSIQPFHPDAARASAMLVELHTKSGDAKSLVGSLEDFSDTYGPNSGWAKSGIGGAALQKEITGLVEGFLLSTGTTAHAALQDGKGKTPDGAVQHRLARMSYQKYIEHFPTTKKRWEIQYYLAELEFEQGNFAESLPHYTAVQEASAKSARAYAHDAALGVFQSLGKLLEADAAAGKSLAFSPDVDVKKVKLSPSKKLLSMWAKEYQRAADAYAKRFPRKQDASVYLFHAVMLSVQHAQKADAKKRLTSMQKSHPGAKATTLAKQLVARLR